jgi:hypothetical protein
VKEAEIVSAVGLFGNQVFQTRSSKLFSLCFCMADSKNRESLLKSWKKGEFSA